MVILASVCSYEPAVLDYWVSIMSECKWCDVDIYDDMKLYQSKHDEKKLFCCATCAAKWDEENGWEYNE